MGRERMKMTLYTILPSSLFMPSVYWPAAQSMTSFIHDRCVSYVSASKANPFGRVVYLSLTSPSLFIHPLLGPFIPVHIAFEEHDRL